jgi:SHS2 domain-containing protein
MLRMVLQDGGDEKVLERVRALFDRMTDIEKTQFVQMLVKAVTGNDLADATLKQSIRQGDK